MKQFVTEESFWELFPEAQIGIVVAHNMKPTEEVAPEDAAAIARALAEANSAADQHLESNTISQNEVVAVWREAYQKFKTKKGARCSIENLLKREMCIRDSLQGVTVTLSLFLGSDRRKSFLSSVLLYLLPKGRAT